MGKASDSRFRFRKHDSIGAADAEEDEVYLRECFVDSGDLDVLRSASDRRRIVLGRTGTGKTALLRMLETEEDHVVKILPEQLSLAYLSNSTILKYLANIGVNLDLFYRLLWKHVFAVELIKERHRIRTEEDKKNFLTLIYQRLSGDKKKSGALEYLTEWGAHFWEETEYRIKEVTTKLESDVRASLGTKSSVLDAGISGNRILSEEEKSEVCKRAQDVVNNVQIRKLLDVIEALKEDILDDPLYRVFLVIDRLDDQWVDDEIRFRLIRALLEAVRDFGAIRNAKIIVALRRDLLDRVIQDTRDEGFQEEKYASLYIHLQWSKNQILQVLDRRVNFLVKSRYTTRAVSYRDLLPEKIGGMSVGDYLCDRTHRRPRDIIHFFNTCIRKADGQVKITRQMLHAAEVDYSRDRLRFLADEWHSIYPDIVLFWDLLKGRDKSFRAIEWTEDDLLDVCVDVLASSDGEGGPLLRAANAFIDQKMGVSELRGNILSAMYRVGLIGLKLESFTAVTWSYSGATRVAPSEISDNCLAYVSPVFFRVLGIVDKR